MYVTKTKMLISFVQYSKSRFLMKWFKLFSKSLKRNILIKITEGALYDLYHLEGSLCPKV